MSTERVGEGGSRPDRAAATHPHRTSTRASSIRYLGETTGLEIHDEAELMPSMIELAAVQTGV